MIINKIQFPEFTGIKCNMMPFIQGDSSSLPKKYQSYAEIINNNFLEKGKIGLLTIDESFVKANTSQRGFNYTGVNRNVHIEVGINNKVNRWGSGGGSSWGGHGNTLLADTTQVLIANNIDNTCRVWDVIEKIETRNGDLTHVIDKYPEETDDVVNIIGSVVLTIILIALVFTLNETVMGFVNPEYGAIKDIINFISNTSKTCSTCN